MPRQPLSERLGCFCEAGELVAVVTYVSRGILINGGTIWEVSNQRVVWN
jgi:hypothetical protein